MKKLRFVLLAVVALAAASCGSLKNITMLQDMEVGKVYSAQEVPEAHIRKGDKLVIEVTCKNAALASPFNLVLGTQNVDETNGTISNVPRNTQGYTVDRNGDINFPVLGILHIEGLTLEELKNDIQNRIIEKNYIKDPIVFVEFLNFEVTTLGRLGNGVQTITNGSVNILELLAMCGGMQNDSKLDDLWVIRTEGNKRVTYSINLKSESLFDSPAFYLQQGDIVYAKPRIPQKDGVGWQISGAAFSAMSSISMTLYWLTNIFNWKFDK